MTLRKASFLQGVDGARYTLPAEDHRLNHAGLWLSDTARGPLAVRSGVVWGPGNPGAVTVVTGGVNISPFHAVIQGTINGVQGPYEVTSDATEFREITAASATEFRRGYVVARVYDRLQTDTVDQWLIEVIYGPNSTTAGAATLPAVPANALVLREFAVDNAGVITLVGATQFTTPRGGRLWLPTEADAANIPTTVRFEGMEVWASNTDARGVFDGDRWVWYDTRWQVYTPTITVGNLTPITLGAARLYGRYFRKGREVSVHGFFGIESGTSFGGQNGIVKVSYPAGLHPMTTLITSVNVLPGGNCRIAGNIVVDGFILHDLQPGAVVGNRRMVFATERDALLQGGASTVVNISAIGHSVQWSGTYETAFE